MQETDVSSTEPAIHTNERMSTEKSPGDYSDTQIRQRSRRKQIPNDSGVDTRNKPVIPRMRNCRYSSGEDKTCLDIFQLEMGRIDTAGSSREA